MTEDSTEDLLPLSDEEHRLTRPDHPARRWTRRVLTTLLVLGALAGLALSTAVFLARGELRSRLDRLEEATGRQIRVADLDIGLAGGVTLSGLDITAPDSDQLAATIGRVEANLSLIDLIGGARRPSQVTVHDLRLKVAVDQRGVHGFEDLEEALRSRIPGGGAAASGSAEPVELRVEGGDIGVELRLPSGGSARLALSDLDATLTRAAGTTEVRGTALLHHRGQARTASIELVRGAETTLALGLDSPLALSLTHQGREVFVSASAISWDPAGGGHLTLTDASLASAGHALKCGTVEVRGEPGSRIYERPRTVTCADMVAVAGGEAPRHARAASVSAELRALPPGSALPAEPRRLVVKALSATLGQHGKTQVGALAVDFAEGALEHALAGRFDRAVDSIVVVGPEGRLRLPEGGAKLGGLVGALPKGDEAAAKAAPSSPLPRLTPDTGGLRRALVELASRVALEIREGRFLFENADGTPLARFDNLGLHIGKAADGSLGVRFDALLVRGAEATGAFELKVELSPEGAIKAAKGTVGGKDLAHILSGFSDYVTVEPDAELEVSFSYEPGPDGSHRVKGSAAVEDFGFQAWRISHSPITGLEGGGDFDVTWVPAEHRLEIALDNVRIGEMKMAGSLDLRRPPNAGPKLEARFEMPRQDCGAAAASIPKGLIPRLSTLKMRGEMWTKARLAVDVDEPKEIELDVDGDFSRCKILSLGPSIDLQALTDRYVHHPVEPEKGRLEHISVGPGTSQWVSSRLLPRFVKAAAVVTEDRGYYDHGGVRWQLIRRALALNIKKGRFVYGGSTITQQLVKNLYLTREKTLSRKLEELIISVQMERELTKDQILTLYVNVVEYGPEIYGVKRASRFYFAKQPWELSPLEAAFIMGLKPFPMSGFKQWKRYEIRPYWAKRLAKVVDMMYRREHAITYAEVLASAPYQPKFRRPEEPMSGGARYVPPSSDVPEPPGD